ncbi:hypothetical protein MMYC01_203935 [Madurella mycetomatis]|uniref:Uncharacterized protein n=1 Tax=Madurella mycetomatis TaxID=100816 RepID=A0A175WAY3_9PEZI|nr:hypothetical protein MMYC01_203935 [Madurella mycetomatis]
MAGIAGLIVSAVGTAVTLVSFSLDQIPTSDSETATVSYVIANDGANGDLTSAGGNKPDLRMWDETGEFIAIETQDDEYCGEGWTTCSTDVGTLEAPTYTLFTGNDDAICIAWAGISFPGGNQKFGFHPGQWAHACSNYEDGGGGGKWYYAGTSVPGLDENVETVYCAWVDRDGDIETTGFQVHWPEFDGEQSEEQSMSYYCDNRPPVDFREEEDPSTIWRWNRKRSLLSGAPSLGRSLSQAQEAPPGERKRSRKRRTGCGLPNRFERDRRLIKSYRAHHRASELCDPNGNAVGQSFVSYVERMFCHMPTKTLYPFCEDVTDGACWSDAENRITAKGDRISVENLPDMSHINRTIVWE